MDRAWNDEFAPGNNTPFFCGAAIGSFLGLIVCFVSAYVAYIDGISASTLWFLLAMGTLCFLASVVFSFGGWSDYRAGKRYWSARLGH